MADKIDIFGILNKAKKIGFTLLRTILQGSDLKDSDIKPLFKNGFIFKQYSSLEEVFDLIENLRNNRSNLNTYEQSALNRVSNDKYKNFETFLNFTDQENKDKKQAKILSENIIDNIDSFVNLGGLFKNDRLKITQDDRGVFDFGLASLGLYRPIEFYSTELKNDIENDIIENPFTQLSSGLINPDDVRKINNQFLYKTDNKDYLCEKRQKGATDVFNAFFDVCELKPNQDNLILTYLIGTDKVFNGKGNIRLKYASSNKKSYLMFEKKDDNVKYVDIFMPLNQVPYISDSVRVLSFIPAFLIAGSLEKYGIKVRISAMRLGSDEGVHTTVSIPVKDYDESTKESFDRSFAILTSYDLVRELFGFLKILVSNDGTQASPTGSKLSGFDSIAYWDRKYINMMMQRYKNWSKENKDEPFIDSKVNNPNFQFALNSSVDKSIKGKKVTQQDLIGQIHTIFFKYYYYMDFLALEMRPMLEFVKSVYTRFVNDKQFNSLFEIPTDKEDLKEILRSYIVSMLVEKYEVVKGGKYADTSQQIEEKENKFQSKIDSLDEALNAVL